MVDEKKDPSPSVAGDNENDEPLALEKGKVERGRVDDDGPDSTEREYDPASAAEDAKITFPDGGIRAWFVVAGALVSLVLHTSKRWGAKESEGDSEVFVAKCMSSRRFLPSPDRPPSFSLRPSAALCL